MHISRYQIPCKRVEVGTTEFQLLNQTIKPKRETMATIEQRNRLTMSPNGKNRPPERPWTMPTQEKKKKKKPLRNRKVM